MASISADEVALYDRQIRLWGMQAQEAIRNAKILLINVKSLGSEIAKNLVLAGIGSLTIHDNDPVTEDDLAAQFLVAEADLGKPRALAALPNMQKLKPRVNIYVETDDPSAKDPTYFSAFDITIATDSPITKLLLLDAAVRFGQSCFYAAGSHGMYGFVFADLVEHTFIIERAKPNVATQAGPETATRRVVSVADKPGADGQGPLEVVTKQEVYQPMILANASPLAHEIRTSRRRTRQVTPLLPCLRALWEFEKAFAHAPAHSKHDLIAFTKLATEQCHELALPIELLTDTFLRKFLQSLGAELAPVCAFLAGKLAEDVVNVLGRKEQPIQNLLLFDADACVAPVYALYPLVPVQTESLGNGAAAVPMHVQPVEGAGEAPPQVAVENAGAE